jgi:Zn-finger nucleic acid-binding protein
MAASVKIASDMSAETLNCPMCGASASSESSRCEHCGARLATIACPSCFGMMFRGAKFCAHCGAKAERSEVAADSLGLCPRDQSELIAVKIGVAQLSECPRCDGTWVDAGSLRQICANQEQQSAVLGLATTLPANDSGQLEAKVRYLPCPLCRKLMNRVNFANCSRVIVDVCREHGTWFDKDELRRIVEFIREGGLIKARENEIRELEAKQRRLRAVQTAGAWDTAHGRFGSDALDRQSGISAAATVLKFLF